MCISCSLSHCMCCVCIHIILFFISTLYFNAISGSVLEGPDPSVLKPIVEQAVPTLIEALSDSSVVVRDTTAWTLGRICELIPEAACNETYLKVLVEALVNRYVYIIFFFKVFLLLCLFLFLLFTSQW